MSLHCFCCGGWVRWTAGSPALPAIATKQLLTVLVKLPQPCWLKVSTTISPRRFRSSGSPSARSAAELAARGYSPPTPVNRLDEEANLQ